MPKGNFGKSFTEGLSPYLHSTSNFLARYILQQGRQEEEDKERLDLATKDRYQNDMLSNLVSGKVKLDPTLKENRSEILPGRFENGKYVPGEAVVKPTDRDLTEEEKLDIYSNLTPQRQNAYEWTERQREKEIERNKPVEQPKPKKLATATGYNKKGEQEIFIKYEDGSEIRIPTGFIKTKSNGTGGETKKFDSKKFNKTLDGFTEELVKINGLRKQYETDGSQYTASSINLLNETNESLLRTMINEDDEMSKAVSNYYDELKETFGEGFRSIEISKQNELKEKFLATMKEKAIEGEISIDKFRALTLWIQFKYGYQY